MGLTPEQFGKMTPGEFRKKLQGFYDYQRQYLLQQSWLFGLTAGMAFGASKEYPYPSFPEFEQMLSKPQETDEELFELAKSKGIEVPEGM